MTSSPSRTGAGRAARPNLIVIMLDSFRQDHAGVYHQWRAPFAGGPSGGWAIAPCQTPMVCSGSRHRANSAATYPPPMINIDAGSSGSRITVSEVW